MQEPSIWDYIKDRLAFWRTPTIDIPDPEAQLGEVVARIDEEEEIAEPVDSTIEKSSGGLSWRIPAVFGLALFGQFCLEPPRQWWTAGIFFYLAAFVLLFFAEKLGEWVLSFSFIGNKKIDPLTVRTIPLLLGVVLSVVAFLSFGSGLFNLPNLAFWLGAVGCMIWAFWLPEQKQSRATWTPRRLFTPAGLLVAAGFVLVIFLRFYQLNQVPAEMVSDHAEKLLDVMDVLAGKTAVFFPRNTGREGFQMYLTALISMVFGTGLSFLSLKLGTVLCGLATLPYIYLLGKELGSQRAGILAALFAGIAYWANVISRIGLRFPLYSLFAAPALYYLIRGLRRGTRNDFIWAGVALGVGLHGYSSMRIVPLVVVIAVVLYLLHRASKGGRLQAIYGLGITAVVSLVVFIPLFRYMMDHPEMFFYRALTRVGSLEQPLPGPAVLVFLGNLWKAVIMFFWDNNNIWVHSVGGRPALDVISAALLALGVILFVIRYARQHNWEDLFLILSVPLLMLPSILSLAFPNENPSLNRPSAAMVPVFVIVGMTLDSLMRSLEMKWSSERGRKTVLAGVVILFLLSSGQNYDLVFRQYKQAYLQNSWNTTEMGSVLRNFVTRTNSPGTAWVVAYPYWVDTRLVGFNADMPGVDTAIQPADLENTAADPAPKLFLIAPLDQTSLQKLISIYPMGVFSLYTSKVPSKDFYVFQVPPLTSSQP